MSKWDCSCHIHNDILLNRQCSQSTPLPQHYSKQWTMFTKAMDIARDVYSSLKKAQQLCKLNPKVWEYLIVWVFYSTCRHIYQTTHHTFSGIWVSTLHPGWKCKCFSITETSEKTSDHRWVFTTFLWPDSAGDVLNNVVVMWIYVFVYVSGQ